MCVSIFTQEIIKTASIEKSNYTSYTATAYCLKGKTASGTRVSIGTLAVDPKIIPLGSKVEIEGYGLFTALDTGSAIKGKRLDLWMNSCSAARKFGKRKVQVKIIRKIKV